MPAYLTAAAAIGMREEEVKVFVTKLDKVLTKVKERRNVKGEEEDEKTLVEDFNELALVHVKEAQ